MTENVKQLQFAVDVLLRTANLPGLSSDAGSHPTNANQSEERYTVSNTAEEDLDPSDCDNDHDVEMPSALGEMQMAQSEDTIYSPPINSLYEVTRLPGLRDAIGPAAPGGTSQNDFIARHIIDEALAKRLFQLYVSHLDFFCYGIMCPHADLNTLRNKSALLTAGVCTVSALHDQSHTTAFKACHAEYLRLVQKSMFSHSYSIDDLRALVIGAYWLPGVSYTLIGHAIRIAMRQNFHLSFFPAIEGSQPDIEKARLWYVLYILDHHSSILYGRPAMISASEAPHQRWEDFIRANGSCEVDLRMSSQVALYHVTAKVKEIFGTYSTQSIPHHFLGQLHGHFSELDRWSANADTVPARNAYVGWFPRDGAILHLHFARLHLCSHIFRGMSIETFEAASVQVREYAEMAVSSAQEVLQLVLDRDDLRNSLVGMPIYFHGMINFAAVFLLKTTRTTFLGLTSLAASDVVRLVQRCINELQSQRAARQHLVYRLSSGLENMMKRMGLSADDAGTTESNLPTTLQLVDQSFDSIFDADTFGMFQYSQNPNGYLQGPDSSTWGFSNTDLYLG
ncbi:hypothetical protein KC333_g9091 [Hortaea werneckii]|nr:hypothetical protein KC333_g9091 [Hortaea werneckii]KAI7301934.1 hypothetical protein KC326_g9090 [Hortaea werneckii]